MGGGRSSNASFFLVSICCQRLREGYPRKTVSAEEAQRKLQQEELQYVTEVESSFTYAEVLHFVKTFRPMMSSVLPLSKSLVLRMIAVSILMKARADSLVIEDDREPQDNLHRLITQCDETIQDSCVAWRGWHGSYEDLLLEARKSFLFRYIFEKVHPNRQLETLGVTSFVPFLGGRS